MKITTLKPDRIVKDLDKKLAILGLIASLILILWLVLAVGRYIEVGILLFLACAIYLLIAKRRSVASASPALTPPAKPSTYLMLSALFFALFSYSIMSVALRPELYSRPLGYFVATALMAAVLATEMILAPVKKSYTYFTLFQIIVLGLSLRFSPQLLFPGVVGVDPWFHQMFTAGILESGHIPEGLSYSKLPIMHLIIGSTSLATGLDYPLATMLSLSLMQVIIYVTFTFLLGRLLGNPKAGLLGALVLMIVPDVLAIGFALSPTGLGLIWMLPISYVLFKAREKRSITLICLSFLFMGVSILSHTLSASAMAILLFCFWIGFEIYKRAWRESFKVPVSLNLSVLYTVGMLGWWMYASGSMFTVAELIRSGFRVVAWAASAEVMEYMSQVAYSEYLLNILGFLLFYTFAIIGSLHMLSPAVRHNYAFSMVLGGYTFIAFAFFSIPLELSGVLTHRWFYYSQLIMTIPVALGLISLSSLCSNRLISNVFFIVLTLAMCFLMTTNATTNFDNPIYAKNLTVRKAFTASELQGMNTISGVWEGRVAAVHPDVYYFRFNREMHVVMFGSRLYNKDFTDCQDTMVIIREDIIEHPFLSDRGILRLDYDPRQALEEQGFSRIYNCESVSSFYRGAESNKSSRAILTYCL